MQAIDGTKAGRLAAKTFAGFAPAASILRRRAEVAVCGQPFALYSDGPITNEMICERDAYVLAFVRVCKPTTAIVARGNDCCAAKHTKARAKVTA